MTRLAFLSRAAVVWLFALGSLLALRFEAGAGSLSATYSDLPVGSAVDLSAGTAFFRVRAQ